jgi:hypothetical protein
MGITSSFLFGFLTVAVFAALVSRSSAGGEPATGEQP